MARYDVLIRGGRLVDGTGADPVIADVAVKDGLIAEVGPGLSGTARETIDAEGHIVTPGFIDLHTHFDGQATWDDRLDPAFDHGVTTAIMGNCGVGFAPVLPGAHHELIDIMEGVEDIPGIALYDAMPWGAWESYPEYLAYLRGRSYSMDIGSQIAHGALRAYVMGADNIYDKLASPAQIEKMAGLIREAMLGGAMGFSSNRILGHRGLSGEQVPGTFASEEELTAFARALGATGAGVMQIIPGEATGEHPTSGRDPQRNRDEVAMMGRLSRTSGRPITFTMSQAAADPNIWRETLSVTEREVAQGAKLFPQFAARPPGIVCGLTSYHMFQRRETMLKLRQLPFDEMVREMRRPEVKAAILADRDISDERPGSMENWVPELLRDLCGSFFSMGMPVDYEPKLEESVGEVAKRTGQTEESIFYDGLLECDGRNFLMIPIMNYLDGNHNAIREMFCHPNTLSGLSDAGAHLKLICDASIPTYTLTHWVRDRSRGPRLPLEFVIEKMTSRNAKLYDLEDRGRIAPGLRADVNVIDLDALSLQLPEMRWDLPTGAGRIVQPAKGYRATFVKGVMTRAHDQDTGQRPGRLLSGAAYVG